MYLYKDPAYRRVVFIGLLVQIIAAWFSVGYHYPDEHFQVYELCNYKLGFSPASDLPWEFKAQIRSGLQPFIVYGLCKALLAMHAYNPFTVAFIMRLVMGVLTWLVSCRLIKQLLPEIETEQGKKLFVYGSFLLWFVPYIGVRFSAENLAGLLFLLAISLLLDPPAPPLKRLGKLIITGLLLGFSICFRLQMCFAFIGLGIWLIFIRKLNWTNIVVMALAGLVAIGLSTLADKWLYGTWVFPPYNYYYANMVQNIAARWGVKPWWYYFELFLETAVPPLSLVLLILFFIGIRRKAMHVLGLCCITFLVAHMAVGHKELRFLFPMTFPMIFFAAVGADKFIAGHRVKRWQLITFQVSAVINIALLAFKSLTPAQEVVSYFHYIYNYAERQPVTIVSLGHSPYDLDKLECNFYKPRNADIHVLNNIQQLDTLANKDDKPRLFITQYKPGGLLVPGYKPELLYCIFPSWVLKVNINNWQDRSRIWAIYRLIPAPARN